MLYCRKHFEHKGLQNALTPGKRQEQVSAQIVGRFFEGRTVKEMSVNGNMNALRNGSKASYRLILGDLPKPLERVKRNARQYRRDLEAAVQDRHGDIDIIRAHAIDAAVGAETHASICRWLLNTKIDSMSVADIVTCSREIARAKDTRNRIVRQLGLDPGDGRTITALYQGIAATACHADGPGDAGTAAKTSDAPDAPDATPEA